MRRRQSLTSASTLALACAKNIESLRAASPSPITAAITGASSGSYSSATCCSSNASNSSPSKVIGRRDLTPTASALLLARASCSTASTCASVNPTCNSMSIVFSLTRTWRAVQDRCTLSFQSEHTAVKPDSPSGFTLLWLPRTRPPRPSRGALVRPPGCARTSSRSSWRPRADRAAPRTHGRPRRG